MGFLINPYNFGSAFITATGGTITTVGDYKVHSFTSSGTFTVTIGTDPTNGNKVEYLVLGGGAGGPIGYFKGGGHSGAINQASDFSIAAGSFAITVGDGGAGVSGGGGGGSSAFGAITAAGGGASLYSAGSGIGGAASGPNGGPGLASSITGSSLFYGGGGGAGADYVCFSAAGVSNGSGGSGVGGNGGPPGANGGNGVANRGSGGGGGGVNTETCSMANGGSGSAGIVIIKYKFQ